MTKYDGIKVVKLTKTNVQHSEKTEEKKEEKNTSAGGFFIRLFFAALIVSALFFAKTFTHPTAQKTVAIIKDAVTYDMNERESEELGEVKFVELLKRFFSQKQNTDDEN